MRPDLPARPPTPVRPLLLGVAAAAVLAVTVSACGSGGGSATGPSVSVAAATSAVAAPTAPVLATVGGLAVAAGYVPAPASADVAAAYFTVVNTGGTADSLVGARSDASTSTTMHRTEGGAMVMLDDAPVPAGGTLAFTPGANHLMLEGLTRTLAEGDRVTLTLQFAHAGTVAVTVPVTGYPTGGELPSSARTPLPTVTASS